jgi:hypothetical protein
MDWADLEHLMGRLVPIICRTAIKSSFVDKLCLIKKAISTTLSAGRLKLWDSLSSVLISKFQYFRFIRAPAKSKSNFGYIVNKSEITKRGFKTYFTSPGPESQSLSLCDGELVTDTAGLKIAGEKRKRVGGSEGDSFELSSSQSWTKGKRLRSSQIRTPVRL